MKNGKLFSKFSVIDAIVAVILILLVAVICVRCGFFKTPEKAQQKVETYETQDFYVTVAFNNITKKVRNDIMSSGQAVYLDGKKFGVVESVEKAPMESVAMMDDGTSFTTDLPGTYTYTVKIKATLTAKNNFWRSASDVTVAIGKMAKFNSCYFSGKGTVISVEKIQ